MGKIIIHVEGGVVRAVYSDTTQSVNVLDLDIPRYPTGKEISEIKSRINSLDLAQDNLIQIY